MKSFLINRNIIASSGRSSMRLEPEIWSALRDICERESVWLDDLIQHIEAQVTEGGRTSAVRTFAFQYFRHAAAETDSVQGLAEVIASQPRRPVGRPPRLEPPRRGMTWMPGVRA
ncbi:ribbon-helix-helix domain-containing protein [Acidisphaera sp. L21]|uniref:ribbon-helix-helix domain-containing protein n=1 Tax=Acidisphaera sp. L21 TaxID=1641851 RepID=UPI00131E0DC2|nr:ribbon-helix-helix domain-containing protein [Acidisphaera sp. L21]